MPIHGFVGKEPLRSAGVVSLSDRACENLAFKVCGWKFSLPDMSGRSVFYATVFVTTLLLSGPIRAADSGVKITDADGKLRIEVNGELFTEYHYTGAPHVYFY